MRPVAIAAVIVAGAVLWLRSSPAMKAWATCNLPLPLSRLVLYPGGYAGDDPHKGGACGFATDGERDE